MSHITGQDMPIHYITRRGAYRSLFARTRSFRTAITYAAALGLAAIVGGAMATEAAAQEAPTGRKAVEIKSQVMLERAETNERGEEKVSLVNPSDPGVVVVPGDRLLVTLTYTNKGADPAANFVAINPINPAVRVTGISEDWAEVSVDGGGVWGKLEELTVMQAAPEPGEDADAAEAAAPTARPAQYSDVTHIRWKFADPIPAGATGEISFRGVVK